jgi:hypothetical protein
VSAAPTRCSACRRRLRVVRATSHWVNHSGDCERYGLEPDVTQSPALSDVMLAALRFAGEHDGQLVRRPGGFWTWPDCREVGGVPEWYVTAHTINALVDRGLLTTPDYRVRPITVSLLPEGS